MKSEASDFKLVNNIFKIWNREKAKSQLPQLFILGDNNKILTIINEYK